MFLCILRKGKLSMSSPSTDQFAPASMAVEKGIFCDFRPARRGRRETERCSGCRGVLGDVLGIAAATKRVGAVVCRRSLSPPLYRWSRERERPAREATCSSGSSCGDHRRVGTSSEVQDGVLPTPVRPEWAPAASGGCPVALASVPSQKFGGFTRLPFCIFTISFPNHNSRLNFHTPIFFP